MNKIKKIDLGHRGVLFQGGALLTPEDYGPYGYSTVNLTKEELEAQQKVPSEIAFINGVKIKLSKVDEFHADWIGRALVDGATAYLPKASRWARFKMWCRNFYYRYFHRGS